MNTTVTARNHVTVGCDTCSEGRKQGNRIGNGWEGRDPTAEVPTLGSRQEGNLLVRSPTVFTGIKTIRKQNIKTNKQCWLMFFTL